MLAIAALVSCSKDDVQGPALDSANKSVEITIANGSGATRAGEAGVTPGNAGNSAVTCVAKELSILFANAGGTIMKVLPLTTQATAAEHIDTTGEYAPGYSETPDTYVWHNVPAAVTQVAVVRDNQNDKPITPGTTTLEQVKAGATDEAKNLARPISEVFLYAESALTKNSTDHVTVNGTTFYYWEAEMEVKPAFARVELTQISCTDLGALNIDSDPATVSLDKLVVNSLTWNSSLTNGYNINANPVGTMFGVNVSSENAESTTADKVIYANEEETTPGTQVWSWNVLPSDFAGMDLNITGTAYDYAVVDDSIALKVTGLSKTEGSETADANGFVAGYIYRIPLNFTESDLTGQEGKCVKVEVTIVDWVVKTVYPVFGN